MLFFSEKELEFIKKINDELINKVISQRILYYKIENVSSNVYGEVKNKILSQPIEVEALVDIQEKSEQETNIYGVDTKYTIIVYFQKDNIIEKGVDVCVGDYVKYGNILYEIASSVETKFVFGLPTKSLMIRCNCVAVRESSV